MPYSITVSEDGKYIVAKHVGSLTGDQVIQRTREAHALGEKLGINRHLMDVSEARNVDTVTNNFEFAYQNIVRSQGINMTARVAVLVSPDDHSHDFVETVTRNAGQNVTFFRDRESAIRHLLEGTARG